MRELALAGMIAAAFGLGAFYATGEAGAFTTINVALGCAALLVSGLAGARRLRGLGAAAARRVLLPHVALIALALAAAVSAERLAAWSGVQADLTANRRFELAPATREALGDLASPLEATLYYDPGDPRVRSTRLLLRTLSHAGPVEVRERLMSESAGEVDRYGLSSSNSLVLSLDGEVQIVARPTEAAVLEAVLRMQRHTERILYLTRGAGEGDFQSDEERGLSRLASALLARGYRLRDFVLPAAARVPDDASAVILAGPQRPLREGSIEALRAYLERGGRVLAMLEPGRASGLAGLLEDFGFRTPHGVIVDPASGPVEGGPAGVNPIIESYSEHPVTQGLGPTRMTFFLTARPVFAERKPGPEDTLSELLYTSRRAWLAGNVEAVQDGLSPQPAPDAGRHRYVIVSTGRYPREAGEARIAVFGDRDFATNQYVRALYNMDLLLNTVHWLTEREAEISLLPKPWTPIQRPLTPQETLTMLYAVGLLLPELLLIAAATVWLRKRQA